MTTTTTSLADGTMVDRIAQFDLNQEIADAANSKPWPAGHFAKTLFKKHDLRVVLINMERGAHMKEHHADGTISIQVLNGRVRVNVAGKPHDLSAGNLHARSLHSPRRRGTRRCSLPADHLLAQRGRACGDEASRLRQLTTSWVETARSLRRWGRS